MKWATSSRVNIPVNFYVLSNNNLRPSSFKTYSQAGTPASLLKKADGTVTPIAMSGMTNPRGHAFTGISTSVSNANGDVAFVATSMDLSSATSFTALYRYFDDALTEWLPFNQPVGGLNGTDGTYGHVLSIRRDQFLCGGR